MGEGSRFEYEEEVRRRQMRSSFQVHVYLILEGSGKREQSFHE